MVRRLPPTPPSLLLRYERILSGIAAPGVDRPDRHRPRAVSTVHAHVPLDHARRRMSTWRTKPPPCKLGTSRTAVSQPRIGLQKIALAIYLARAAARAVAEL